MLILIFLKKLKKMKKINLFQKKTQMEKFVNQLNLARKKYFIRTNFNLIKKNSHNMIKIKIG